MILTGTVEERRFGCREVKSTLTLGCDGCRYSLPWTVCFRPVTSGDAVEEGRVNFPGVEFRLTLGCESGWKSLLGVVCFRQVTRYLANIVSLISSRRVVQASNADGRLGYLMG